MKRWISLFITCMLLFTCTACGAKKNPDDNGGDVGGDWHTWAGYVPMEWKTPDGTETIYMESRSSDGAFRIIAEGTEYTPICDCTLPQAESHDWGMIQNSIHCEDRNEDGYDDIVLKDSDGNTENELVYVWNTESKRFERTDH
ncbi:MAG: hypothetical protein MJ175_10860 [Clostridia bacterium]|nr:hypothetical protein [Clostridia bacterium]